MKRIIATGIAATVIAAGIFFAGCSKKADTAKEPAAKEPAAAAAPAKTEAPASKYTFAQICKAYVDGKREAYKSDPYPEETYVEMENDCVTEFEPNKGKEGVIADALMAKCEGKTGTDFLNCFDTEKAGVIEANK